MCEKERDKGVLPPDSMFTPVEQSDDETTIDREEKDMEKVSSDVPSRAAPVPTEPVYKQNSQYCIYFLSGGICGLQSGDPATGG